MAFLGSMIAQARPRPRAVRHRTLIKASLSGLRLADQPVLVRNVSERGLGMTTQGQVPQPGQQVSVSFASGLLVGGRVAWAQGNSFGVGLDQPISVARLEAATQRQNESLGRAIAWQVEQAFTPAPSAPRGCFV